MVNTYENTSQDNSVTVRNRSFLAGSNHDSVPVSIPDGRDGIPQLDYDLSTAQITENARQVRSDIDEKLKKSGAVLVRAKSISISDDFSQFVDALEFPKGDFKGGIAVRNHSSKKAVIASSEDQCITLAPHNEMSYLPNFPRRIFFFCEIAASVGGEVPINDIRLTKERIPTELIEKFREHGVRYTRHLPSLTCGAHLSWSDTFGEKSKSNVESYLIKNGFEFKWDQDENLAYSYVNPALVNHPETGEELWFNQVTELHSSYWRNHPEFEADLSEICYPAATSFGNGEAIELDTIHYLRGLLWQTSRAIKMQPGEVLILDNYVMQHGRFSYEGERKHYVRMSG